MGREGKAPLATKTPSESHASSHNTSLPHTKLIPSPPPPPPPPLTPPPPTLPPSPPPPPQQRLRTFPLFFET